MFGLIRANASPLTGLNQSPQISCMPATCVQSGMPDRQTDVAESKKSIVGTLLALNNFKILTQAIENTILLDALERKVAFTFFAPTDEAFGKLPDHVVDDLFKPENQEKLTDFLAYHVVPGELRVADFAWMADLINTKFIETATGRCVTIRVDNETVAVDNAKIINADIKCSNGVIHGIDAVLGI